MEGFGWSWRSQKNPRDQREQSSMDLPSPITRQQSQTQYIKNLCPYPYLCPPSPSLLCHCHPPKENGNWNWPRTKKTRPPSHPSSHTNQSPPYNVHLTGPIPEAPPPPPPPPPSPPPFLVPCSLFYLTFCLFCCVIFSLKKICTTCIFTLSTL